MSARIVSAEEGMAEAVERLRAGLLVAFPTETVYGLGANALDADAVARIFAAKGRPATNPVIVHVADVDAARRLASAWPDAAQRLADAFWPGPLTLVVPKSDVIPSNVTAGGPTVGLRVPNHPVALELLRRAGVPVAAPSANRSEEVSPTTAQHVADSLSPYVDDLLILDGGPCQVGIESTVVDVTADPPRVLRPGMVTAEQLASVLGSIGDGPTGSGPARSPGQMLRHYAPSVPLVLISRDANQPLEKRPGDGLVRCSSELARVAALYGLKMNTVDKVWSSAIQEGKRAGVISIQAIMSDDPEGYARHLYSVLHDMERIGVQRILIEEPPHGPEWEAIHDRLRRAAAPQVGKVTAEAGA